MFVFQIVAENVWTPRHDSHLSNVGVIEVTVEVTDVPDVPPFWVKAPPLTLLSGMDRMQKTLFIDFERLRNIGHVTLELRYFSDSFLGHTHAYHLSHMTCIVLTALLYSFRNLPRRRHRCCL